MLQGWPLCSLLQRCDEWRTRQTQRFQSVAEFYSATIRAVRSLPPLTALRAFEAAARHLSFKTAAEELALTPTAVSHQVRLLEDSLATRLFRRRPRPLALTPAGASLFPAIRGGLDAFAAAIAEVRQGIAQQRLRVTATNAFAARWLVPRLQRWRDAHPEVALELIGTDAVLDLAAGNADIAIRYGLRPPAGLVAEELARDRFWPVGSPTLLASGPPVLRPSDLARFPFIHALWPETYPGAPTWGAGSPQRANSILISARIRTLTASRLPKSYMPSMRSLPGRGSAY